MKMQSYLLSALLLGALGCNSTPSECGDGVDNDGDGTTDANDTMCAFGSSEAPAPGAPACLDGKDNDGDGFIDLDDPGCDDHEDDDEFQPELAACNDGIDNDGDGLVDSPNDPGCNTGVDDDESDDCPSGTGCPACADGIDNDGDGLIDFGSDDGCDRAADTTELSLDTAICGTTLTPLPESGLVTGRVQTSDATNLVGGCGGEGPEVAIAVNITQPVALRATTALPDTWLDTVIYLRSECSDANSEIACNDDDSTGFGPSTLEVERVEPGTYYLVIDSHSGSFGEFALQVEMLVPLGGTCAGDEECLGGLFCNDQMCGPSQCSDGDDNDGDGVADDFDPGCTSSDDNDESPNPDPLPACADGVDNDDNGTTDYPEDPNCSRASDEVEDVCELTDGFYSLDAPTITGTLVGAESDIDGSCGGSGGRDASYVITIPGQLDTFVVDTLTGTSFDSVLRIQQDECTAPELQCNDDSGGDVQSQLSISNLAAGTYFIVVDEYSSGSGGAFTLTTSGVIAAGAACDPTQVASGLFSCADGGSCSDGICQ